MKTIFMLKERWKHSMGSVILIVLMTAVGIVVTLPGTVLAAKTPQDIMRANCASCHGELGEGGYPSWVDPSQTSMRIAGRSKGSIIQWTRNGRLPEMPAFPVQEISDAEVDALATYVNALPGSFIPNPTYQQTVNITDEDPWYNPMQISVNVGDTVKFTNSGKTYHPVTQIEHLATHGTTGTDSGLLGPTLYGGGVYFRNFDTAGKYTFLCKIHPYMRGEVYVGQSIVPPGYAVDTPGPVPATAGEGEVWVNAQWQDWDRNGNGQYDDKDGVIQVINATNWTVTHKIPIGNNPHNIWFGAGNTKAVSTNWFDNTVSRIDAGTKAVLGEYIAGAAPAHVTSDYAGANWYATIEGSNYIQAFKQSTMAKGKTATIGGYGPHGIWYANGKLVTTNSMDSTFSIVNASQMTHLATVDLKPGGNYPLGASANTTATLGAAGNCLSANVSIINMVNNTKIRDIPVPGSCAVQVPFTPDNQYIVAANSPYVTIIDAAKAADPVNYPDPTSAIVASVWTGKGAHGVAFGNKSGGGRYAYVSHKYENYLSVVDMTTMTKAGDVALYLTTTGKKAIVGATDTGGNAIAAKPNPTPWQ